MLLGATRARAQAYLWRCFRSGGGFSWFMMNYCFPSMLEMESDVSNYLEEEKQNNKMDGGNLLARSLYRVQGHE